MTIIMDAASAGVTTERRKVKPTMLLQISNRAERIVQSEISSMSIECERVGGINLAQGVCDTELPLPVGIGAKEAIDAGINSYTRYDGIKELRYAIAKKILEYKGK